MKLSNKIEDIIRNHVEFDETVPYGYVVYQNKHIPNGQEVLLKKVSEIDKFAVKHNGYCKLVDNCRVVGDNLAVRVEMNCDCVAAKAFDSVVAEKANPFIYLSMDKETGVWASVTSPQRANNHAVRFCEEKNYPVELFYARTDVNGSSVFEKEICKSQRDLLRVLNWCGKCGFTPWKLWDFDIQTSCNEKLLNIFATALQKRQEKVQASLDEKIDSAVKTVFEETRCDKIGNGSKHLNER